MNGGPSKHHLRESNEPGSGGSAEIDVVSVGRNNKRSKRRLHAAPRRKQRRIFLAGALVGWWLAILVCLVLVLLVYLSLTWAPLARLTGRTLNTVEGRHSVTVSEPFRTDFLALAFGDKGTVLRRWDGRDVSVCEVGPSGQRDPAAVRAALAEIQPLTQGVHFRYVDMTDGPADITIRYLDQRSFSDRRDQPDSIAFCHLGPGRLVPFGASSIVTAAIYVDAAPELRHRRQAVILHELLHAIGLAGHINGSTHAGNALYASSTATQLSALDRRAVRLLYSGAMASGMIRFQVEGLLVDD